MPAHIANALSNYSLPSKRKDYFPRLKQDYNRRSDGTLEIVRREYKGGHRGDFTLGKDGAFSFAVPFTEGPGVYTVRGLGPSRWRLDAGLRPARFDPRRRSSGQFAPAPQP